MIERAIQIAGGQSRLARALGVSHTAVGLWLRGDRKIAPARCWDIQKMTNGEVTVYDLRPDIFGPNPEHEAA